RARHEPGRLRAMRLLRPLERRSNGLSGLSDSPPRHCRGVRPDARGPLAAAIPRADSRDRRHSARDRNTRRSGRHQLGRPADTGFHSRGRTVPPMRLLQIRQDEFEKARYCLAVLEEGLERFEIGMNAIYLEVLDQILTRVQADENAGNAPARPKATADDE